MTTVTAVAAALGPRLFGATTVRASIAERMASELAAARAAQHRPDHTEAVPAEPDTPADPGGPVVPGQRSPDVATKAALRVPSICVATSAILAATLLVAPPDKSLARIEQYAVQLTSTQAALRPVARSAVRIADRRQAATPQRIASTPPAAESGASFLGQAVGAVVVFVLFYAPALVSIALGTVVWAVSWPLQLLQDAIRWVTNAVSGPAAPAPAVAKSASAARSTRTAARSARSDRAFRRPASAHPGVRTAGAARSARASAASSQRDSRPEPRASHPAHRATGTSARPSKSTNSDD